MELAELESKSVEELQDIAKELEIQDFDSLRKQDLTFKILQTQTEQSGLIFGTGVLDFDKLIPAINQCGVPHDWWAIDLCFWPNAWEVTADSKTFLDKLRRKYAA